MWTNQATNTIVVANGQPLLVYDTVQAANHLILAMSSTDGQDPFGNKYWQGLSLKQSTSPGGITNGFGRINFSIGDATSTTDGQVIEIIDSGGNHSMNVIGPNGNMNLEIDAHFIRMQDGGTLNHVIIGDDGTLKIAATAITLGAGGNSFQQVEKGSGTLVFSGANTSAALPITFTNAMPNATYQILLGVAAITGNTVVSASWFNKSTTGFSLTGRLDNGNVFTGNVAVDWMVIG